MVNRRHFLRGLGASALLVGADVVLPLRPAPTVKAQETAGSRTLTQPWYRSSFIGEPLMDERLIFYLGHSWYHMSDIGECLDTASRIEAGDVAGWRKEWFRTADRLHKVAETSEAGGHAVSAGEAYLRATSYYLAGLIYMESPDDPEMRRTARAVATSFESALKLLNIPGDPVKIPYEGKVLPAYYFRTGKQDAPLLIAHQGMDASVEETYFVAQGALARGYNCLLFHHPGQGLALREHGLTFRPDWENVIRPVVDFALALPDIDPQRIAIMGLSFGGALVLRAAAYEKRIKVCIANPPTYNWGGTIQNVLFGQNPAMVTLLEQDPAAFNAAIEQFLANAPSYYRWWFNAARWKYGQATAADLIKHLGAYSLEGVLDKITCKVLLMDGTAEQWSPGDGEKIHRMLPNSHMMVFTDEDTAAMHNQTGALAIANQRLFDWLDGNL